MTAPPRVITQAEFLRLAAAQKGDSALLFVHGFNTPFESGLYRTAQLAYDLKIYGPVFHYSWPSNGSAFAYAYDDGSVRQSGPYFREFLDTVVERSGTKNLTIIAHSKGNDLVLTALQRFDTEARMGLIRRCCNELVLAAPDVDRDVARNALASVVPMFKGTTLYANQTDLALLTSQKTNGGGIPRAGQLMENGAPLIVAGMDSIDASNAKLDLLNYNHNTYVSDTFIRQDLEKVLKGLRPPNSRTRRLVRVQRDGQVYWRLTPSS